MSAGVQALPSSPAPSLHVRAEADGCDAEWTVQAPAAAYGRPVGLLDPGQRCSSVSFAFSLTPVKVFSSEGMSPVDKQRALKYVPVVETFLCPFARALPASRVSPGNGGLGSSCLKAGVCFSCRNDC